MAVAPITTMDWWQWQQENPAAHPNLTADLVVARCDVYDSVDGRSCGDQCDTDPAHLLATLRQEGWSLEEGLMLCPRHTQ